jgi:hypothetical protein
MNLEDHSKSLILSFKFLFRSNCDKQILWANSTMLLKAINYEVWHDCSPLLGAVNIYYIRQLNQIHNWSFLLI